MTLLTRLDLAALRAVLAEEKLDGWLLYDFRGVNPIPGRVLGQLGMGSRRLFVLLPRAGQPVALVHRIELQPFGDFPGQVIPYARHDELHAGLGQLVRGRRLAMEVSPEDAVPYLDRVPHGVVQLVERLGGTVVPSGQLVTRFAAAWSAAEIADHRHAAGILAEVARGQLEQAVRQADASPALTECALQQRVIEALHGRGLVFDHPPIVAFGPHAALPHYEPGPGSDLPLTRDQVVLLDLWGGRALGGVFADQTWMAFTGPRPPEKVARVWQTVRDARDAAVALVRQAAGHRPLRGYEVDRAARGVIEAAGFGPAFVHRTGHSIDRDLHGSGPHMDDYETHDDRELLPGVGFSVEPGIYLPGEFGVRSEVNMYWGPEGVVLTPERPQRDLITG
jgi:Xaa-Pro aminopeptidase